MMEWTQEDGYQILENGTSMHTYKYGEIEKLTEMLFFFYFFKLSYNKSK